MKNSLETIIDKIIEDIKTENIRTVVLDDRAVNSTKKTIPMLMVVGRLNQRLLNVNLRHLISIVAVTGEVYDAHMSASLLGFRSYCNISIPTPIYSC